MEKLFKLKQNGTTVRTEIIAGLTTFLAMAYILIVNPTILGDIHGAHMDPGAVFTATAISAAFGCAFMAFFANYPIALASGMGLNAYFSYTVCNDLLAAGVTDPWKVALTAILVEGIIFIILSLFKFRETLVNKVPANLKYGISAGIGLFIVIVALKGAGIVVTDATVIMNEAGEPTKEVMSSTLIQLGNLGSAPVALALIGFVIVAALRHFRLKGAILLGIIITWLLGIGAQLIGWYQVGVDGSSLIPDFAHASFVPAMPNVFSFDFGYVASHAIHFAVIVFAFLFVDLFDTVGTVIGVADRANLLDKDGNLPRVGATLMADAVGTVAGACLGTSTVTSYVESSAGVAAGGRTGLTALTTGVLFILALVLSPLFLAIPSFATTPALIYVGLLMMASVRKMQFEGGDIAEVTSGFLALIMMPFTYSIANGIMFGVLSWVILKVCIGKIKEIHPVMWVSSALFILRIVTLVMGWQ